jgi:cyanate lyase
LREDQLAEFIAIRSAFANPRIPGHFMVEITKAACSEVPKIWMTPTASRCRLVRKNRTKKVMTRSQVTQLIVSARLKKGISWAEVAKVVGGSKEWVTAGCLGQTAFNKQQAAALAELFDLSEEAQAILQTCPYRGSLPTAVPTDPVIYRFYELVSVYGTTLKELIHEEFGDGIMSAIDFKMHIGREADPTGERVRIVMSGKFLPYKEY